MGCITYKLHVYIDPETLVLVCVCIMCISHYVRMYHNKIDAVVHEGVRNNSLDICSADESVHTAVSMSVFSMIVVIHHERKCKVPRVDSSSTPQGLSIILFCLRIVMV